jgi:RNA polymerase sigma-70 factor (ECF subfamily)
VSNVSKSEPARAREAGARELPHGEAAEEERELVRRAQAGDPAAYEELVRTHQRRVLSVAARILRQREDIEDVAQQVFVKAYFSLGRFDLRSTFSTWLYKITVNECWDYLRKKRVRPLVYEADLSDEQARHLDESEHAIGAPAEMSRSVELRGLVNRLLDELDEKDRTILLLKEVEGFSVEEIAEMLDLNPNTVKVRMFRARGKLTQIYRQRFGGQRPKRAPQKGE